MSDEDPRSSDRDNPSFAITRDTPSMSMMTTRSASDSAMKLDPKRGGDSTKERLRRKNEELSNDSDDCHARIDFEPEARGLPTDFRLTKYGDLKLRGTKPNLETLTSCLALFQQDFKTGTKLRSKELNEARPDATINDNLMILGEDTLCTRLDGFDLHLIETDNVLTALIDDSYAMGRLACLTVLSGIYSVGIVDVATTRMSLAIPNRMESSERDAVLPLLILGYKDTARESGAVVQCARMTMNPWLLVGGTATAFCPRYDLFPPDRATLGDVIVVTKPLGSTIALLASQWLDQPEKRYRLLLSIDEENVKKAKLRAVDSMLRSNREAALLMRKYNTHASCDVSSYGILGHAKMLAKRQKNPVNFVIHNLPVIAKMTAASRVLGSSAQLLAGVSPEHSGGLMLVLPREQAAAYCKVLDDIEQRQAWIVGLVEEGERTARIINRPRVIEVPANDRDKFLW